LDTVRGVCRSDAPCVSATVTRGVIGGFDVLVLENSQVRISIIPSLGGRVWELLDRVRGRHWIWHREDAPLVASPSGACYDDVWAGGWEELFPNDAPADFEGRALPDHGEWWTTAWTVAEASGGTEAVLRLVADTHVRKTSCTKEFRLGGDDDTVHVSYRIDSREPDAFHFLFKQHLAIALTPFCELALPGGRVTAVDPAFGTLLPGPGPFDWPLARGTDSGEVDLRRVPPAGTEREFVYVTELPENWCGVDDVSRGASIRMRFDHQRLPFLWLFLSYGGWRDCYTAVLEPCTNMPKDLAEAVRSGQSARLEPGGVFQTSVAVTLSALGPRD
jgi:hypothetical protein